MVPACRDASLCLSFGHFMPALQGVRAACRGPHENYVDRCEAAPSRVYSATVPQMHTPYIAPSENGGREGVRWLALLPDAPGGADAPAPATALLVSHRRHGEGATQPWGVRRAAGAPAGQEGAAFVPAEGLHMSVSQFSTGQLLLAKHDNELEVGPCKLHVDGFHMGVGGDDSWTPSVRPSSSSCSDSVQWIVLQPAGRHDSLELYVHQCMRSRRSASKKGGAQQLSYSLCVRHRAACLRLQVHEPYLIGPGKYNFGMTLQASADITSPVEALRLAAKGVGSLPRQG